MAIATRVLLMSTINSVSFISYSTVCTRHRPFKLICLLHCLHFDGLIADCSLYRAAMTLCKVSVWFNSNSELLHACQALSKVTLTRWFTMSVREAADNWSTYLDKNHSTEPPLEMSCVACPVILLTFNADISYDEQFLRVLLPEFADDVKLNTFFAGGWCWRHATYSFW